MSEAAIENKSYGDYRDFIPELKELKEIVDEESSKPGSENGAIKEKENPKEVADTGDGDDEPIQEQEAPIQEEKIDEDLPAQLKAAEEKMRVLEAELEKFRQQQTQPVQMPSTSDNPFSNVNTFEELDKKLEEAWAFKRELSHWTAANQDGGIIKMADGQEKEITPEQARRMLLNVDEAIQFHVPRRVAYLQQRAAYLEQKTQYDVQAKEAYPDLFKSGSPQATELNTLIREWPEVTRFSDCNLVLGDYMSGRKLREERAKKAPEDQKKSIAKSKIPLAPPVPNSRGGAQFNDSKSALKKAERKLFATNGDDDSLTDFFLAKSQANNI